MLKRGAQPIAEVVGFGTSGDASHMTLPDKEGISQSNAIHMALDMAGIKPEDINYINTHGTSTNANDTIESSIIKSVFDRTYSDIYINATKSMTGHSLGAAGAIETIVTALSLKNQKIHPNINIFDLDESAQGLNIEIPVSQSVKINYGLNQSFAFGGNNATLVLKAV